MTLAELDARLGHGEYLQWRAFYTWEVWKAEQRAMAARQRSQ